MSDVRTEERADDVTEASRKRFTRRQWARRWLAWRRVLAAAVVLVVVVGTVWLFFFSTALAVQGVEVQGTRVLEDEQVVAAAAVPTGEALARVDLAAHRGPDRGAPRRRVRRRLAAVAGPGPHPGPGADGGGGRGRRRQPARHGRLGRRLP